MSLTALGLVAGLSVDITLAHLIGASSSSDRVVMALTVPFVADTILREGARYSLISILHDAEDNDLRLGGECVALAVISALVAFILSALVFATFLRGMLPDSGTVVLASATSASFAFCAILLALSDANDVFYLSSSRNLAVHSCALAFFAANVLILEINVLTAALLSYLIGSLAFCGMALATLKRRRLLQRPIFPSRRTFRALGQRFVPSLINVGSGQSMRAMERGSLLQLSNGSLFLFYVAFRVFASLQSLIGGTIATVTMKQNRALVSDRRGFWRAMSSNALQTAIYVAPCSVLLVVFGQKLIEVAYGSKLHAEEIGMAANALKLFAFTLFFQALNVVVTTFWLNQRKVFLMNVITMSVAACAGPLFFLVAPRYGVIGVTVVTCGTSLAVLFANVFVIHRQLGGARPMLGRNAVSGRSSAIETG